MNLIKTAVASVLLASSCVANASFLSGDYHVDDKHSTFLSTDDNVAGSLIANGNWWPTATSFENIELEDGQDYFLHVLGQDLHRVITGFIGEFTLTLPGHKFANGTQKAYTNSIDWMVSKVGWYDYESASEHGDHGSNPWANYAGGGPLTVSTDANWIWSENAREFNDAYFTLAILADGQSETRGFVPEPSTIALMLLGVLGVGLRKHIS